jgi:iron complex outermembrane receptor protein
VISRRHLLSFAVLIAPCAAAQVPAQLAPVVVTATRVESSSFALPAAVDVIDGEAARDGQPRVNLSETIGRVPGVVVQNRQNYAQDLQVSSRGFGARASFGVRGVRLLQDGIPLTMPDGQGQTGLFDLDAVQRIEVLRGPFAALYGNSSGGVIEVLTRDGAEPELEAQTWAGSFGSWRTALRAGGTVGGLRLAGDASRFVTDGYRDHSAARRDLGNARLRYDLGGDATISLIVNALDQPDTQDPLGLTREQLTSDRRQAGTGALAFNTRKSIDHRQGGLVYEKRLSAQDTLRVRGYAGDRQVTQYLALTGVAITSSGGVVDLDRGFGGGLLQWIRRGDTTTLTLGIDYDGMRERRRGFVNNFGVAGDLRRDENDTVHNFDQYLIGEWSFAPRWKLAGGVRHSTVRFKSEDDFITPLNPDDSGSVRYSRTLPVAGLLYELTPRVNAFVSAGAGFETPTFAELAYRPDGATGLNFALVPATSVNYEAGLKALVGDRSRVNLTLFLANTKNDIVNGPSPAPGRNTFVNAARTRRTGVELGMESTWRGGFSAYAALTLVDAKFREFISFTGEDFSGRKLPGVPAATFYTEVAWRHAPTGFSTALEGHLNSKVHADDANSAAASGYGTLNWRASVERIFGKARLSAFVRVDNLTDRKYVGSVIVNASGGQFYEPAPTRNALVGITAKVAF